MQIKLENPLLLSKVVELISNLVIEVKFKIDSSGMSVIAIDPANVAMVRFFLSKDAFSQFDLEAKQEIWGVNLEDLKKILRRAGIKSSLILKREENRLNIEMSDKIKRNFTLNLIDIKSEDKEMPNLEFSAKVEINSADLIDAVEDCAVVADACSFVIENNNFIIEAKSLNSARSEFSGDEVNIQAENCKSKYSIEYLNKFVKGSKLCDKTILNFANDHPLRMDLNIENMELNFILAPRVESED
ncbi:MAG TPA: proliferating cell nuclear antigen (pcna) [Candidatus Nanoarchaeia archaeon]|nr:proliferating cell nuclear antigen (pcna) [Candidatus Nanoarchaeia archaeon]